MLCMQDINCGDVWQVSLEEPQGHEIRGNRPAIIIAIHVETDLTMVIPLTSNSEAMRFPYTLEIKRTKENGLYVDSVALIFQLRSLSVHRFVKKIGVVDRTTMKRIKSLIRDYLAL